MIAIIDIDIIERPSKYCLQHFTLHRGIKYTVDYHINKISALSSTSFSPADNKSLTIAPATEADF